MRTVLYCSAFVPPELIRAHSFEPVFGIMGDTRPRGPVPEVAGACAFMRTFINEACEGEDVAAVIATSDCDQMRRGSEFAERSGKPPMFLLNLPATWQTPGMREAYLTELQLLDRFLSELAGAPLSGDELWRTMQECEAQRAATPSVQLSPDKIPLVVVGAHLTPHDETLRSEIEACGGQVVLDGMESGERGRPALFDSARGEASPLEELARAYFDVVPGIFQRPNDRFFDWLRAGVAESGARGVIVLRQQWCDLWHAEVSRMRDMLDVPLLDLDLAGKEAGARNHMRIQALIETLRYGA